MRSNHQSNFDLLTSPDTMAVVPNVPVSSLIAR
jgi:hypothetical protein